MQYYGSKHLADAFRTVRANTIKIAEEIPEEKYHFRAAEGTRTVAETLAHLATSTGWQLIVHGQRLTAVKPELFMEQMQKAAAVSAELKSKAQILEALRAEGDRFAAFVESLTDEALAERVQLPAGATPPDKSRFEMLLSPKEHEMHHRGQMMVAQRLVGITPHLTRQMQERVAAMQA